MRKIWKELTVKGRIEVVLHMIVATFILGTVYRGYAHLANRVELINSDQNELEESVHTLERRADQIENVEKRLERIVENQDRLRKLIIEYMKSNHYNTEVQKND